MHYLEYEAEWEGTRRKDELQKIYIYEYNMNKNKILFQYEVLGHINICITICT